MGGELNNKASIDVLLVVCSALMYPPNFTSNGNDELVTNLVQVGVFSSSPISHPQIESKCTRGIISRQTTASRIPSPFGAAVRYSRIHLDFSPRSAMLICQFSLVPVFDTNSLRYIVPRLLSSAVTVSLRNPYRFLSQITPCGPTLPQALHGP